MRIVRTAGLGFAGVAVAVWFSASVLAGGQTAPKTMHHDMPMPDKVMTARSPMTKDQKIANAMSGAPASISAKATILDWPAKEGDAPAVLRAGTNGWHCLPDMPDTEGSDPMCLDHTWMKWVEAYMAHATPQLMNVGIGYMIAPGGARGSNTDPYAKAATTDNQWTYHQPHLMILVPDLRSLDSLSTDPHNGGPYVMYKGTPYAHIMAPIAASAMTGKMMK